MKSETLTYPVRAPEGLGESASAPSRLGRSDPASGGLCAVQLSVPFSGIALACWFWMSVQLIGRLSHETLPAIPRAQEPVEIWLSAESDDDDDDEPIIVVRVNRSVLRKLRRLERLKKVTRGGTALRGSVKEETLSPTQLMERRCRQGHIGERRVGRTRVYGLNFGLRELVLRAVRSLSLRGSTLHLRNAAMCSALLSPD